MGREQIRMVLSDMPLALIVELYLGL